MKRYTAFAGAVAVIAAVSLAHAASPTIYGGRYTVDITITLTTAVPSGGGVFCEANVIDIDAGSTNTEAAFAQATVSGSTATCSLSMPYYWELSDPSADTISVSYEVAITPTTTVGSTLKSDVFVRDGTHSLATTTGAPANGTLSTIKVMTRL